MRGYRDLCSKLCNEIYECKALICGHKLTRGAKVGHFTRLNITFCFRSDGRQVKRLGVIATEFRERACIVEIGYKGSSNIRCPYIAKLQKCAENISE